MAHPFDSGHKLGEIKEVDTELMGDTVDFGNSLTENQVDTVYHDTEVLDDLEVEPVENLETQLLDGYDSEVVPDSDDEGIDTTESKWFSRRRGKTVFRELQKVKPQSHPPCDQQEDSNVSHDACVDEGHVSGQAADMAVCKGNDINPVLVQSTLQATELQFKDSEISEVKDADLACILVNSVACDAKSADERKQLNEEAEVDGNAKISQMKTRKVSIVYTRKRSRATCDFKNKDLDEEIRSPDKCNENAGLSYVDSQEPEDLTKVFLFVDKYVSDNVVPSTPTADVTIKEKSPPALSAKGAQNLVSWANIRNRKEETGIFEWDDREGQSVSLGDRSPPSLRGKKYDQKYVRRSPSVRKHENRGILQKEKAENFSNNEIFEGLPHLDAKLEASDIKFTRETEQVHGQKTIEDSDSVLKGESSLMQLEADTIHKESEHVYDFGVDTQMAAEAMQELSFAAPAGCNNTATEKCPDQMVDSLLRGFGKRSHVPGWSFPKKARSVSREIMNQPKQSKEISCLDDQENIMQASEMEVRRNKGKLSTTECLDQRSIEDYSKVKLAKKPKLKGSKRVNKDGLKENLNSIISDEDMALNKLKRRRKHRNIYPLAGNLDSSSLFNVKVGLVNVSESRKMKSVKAGLHDRRKEMGATDKKLEASDQMKIFSELLYEKPRNSSNVPFNKLKDARNTKASQEDMSCILGRFTKWFVKDYPRGKRTCRSMLGRIKGSSDWEECNHYPLRSQSNSDTFNSSFLGSNMKRKRRSSVYISPCWLSSQKSSDGSLLWQVGIAYDNDSATMKKKNISEQMTESTTTMQLDNVDNLGSVSSVHATSRKADDRLVPNKTLKSHDSNLVVSPNCPRPRNEMNSIDGYHEQLGEGKATTSPLTRELVRLGFNGSLPEFKSKDSRRRKTMANIRVLLSQSLDKGTCKQQKKILMRLGVPMASCASDATHFVADKFARTRNMLEFVAQGKPVVTHMWLESCEQAGFYIDERNYILRDMKRERELRFKLPGSLDQARRHPLLKGYGVFITPNTRPGREMLTSLVKASHGQAVDIPIDSTTADKLVLDDLLILSCEEDQACCVPFLQRGAAIYSPELLLNGIIIQKLEFKRHQIFKSYVQG